MARILTKLDFSGSFSVSGSLKMEPQMMSNPFQLLGLPTQFDLDADDLTQRYRQLAAQFHPDKFAAQSTFEQKQAVMMSAAINEAYRQLSHPINRAATLLAQHGIHADAPEHTQFAADFLMQQMQWRETLGDARMENDIATLTNLQNEIAQEQADLYEKLSASFAAQQHDTAAQLVRQGRFLDKLQQEIQAALPE